MARIQSPFRSKRPSRHTDTGRRSHRCQVASARVCRAQVRQAASATFAACRRFLPARSNRGHPSRYKPGRFGQWTVPSNDVQDRITNVPGRGRARIRILGPNAVRRFMVIKFEELSRRDGCIIIRFVGFWVSLHRFCGIRGRRLVADVFVPLVRHANRFFTDWCLDEGNLRTRASTSWRDVELFTCLGHLPNSPTSLRRRTILGPRGGTVFSTGATRRPNGGNRRRILKRSGPSVGC